MNGTPAQEPVAALPSIQSRLANALAAWSLLWGLAVGAAIWVAAAREVNELLDDALRSSGELMAVLVARGDGQPPGLEVAQPVVSGAVERFAWQVVADGTVLLRSQRAPSRPWRDVPAVGLSSAADWRIYGLAVGNQGRMLYVGQTQAERREARGEVALAAVLAAFAVGLLGHAWLRSRVRTELQPLQRVSERLDQWDIDAPEALQADVLGPAERQELVSVHRAVDGVARRLALRVANEQAFSAHAAHSLRTPLAGIDAQLAVTLRDCPSPWRERVQGVRAAGVRLQGVVAALLGLFRSGSLATPVEIDIGELVSRMPAPRLRVGVAGGFRLRADPDLLAAALANLIDNAHRHGAGNVWIEPVDGGLRVRDDGPGVDAARRAELQLALDSQHYEGVTGLGLMLADRVARSHGGRLHLAAHAPGFAADLLLGPGTGTQDAG